MKSTIHPSLARVVVLVLLAISAVAQQPPPGGPPGGPGGPPPGFGGGPMGGGPGMQPERKILKKHDTDSNGYLDATERKAAREALAQDTSNRPRLGGPGGGPGGPGGPPGFGRGGRGPGGPGGQVAEPGRPGEKIQPSAVTPSTETDLFDPKSVRTLFLDFESADWEKELSDFHKTDVDVPAALTVDGKTYKQVGVHFRGMSSYFMIPEGSKRSLNLSLDSVNKGQSLRGHRTLNLINSHEDPSYLRPVLYSHIANQYLPTPRANFVRVVINGENWGVYVCLEQFNKDFTQTRFGSVGGNRWKVTGSPNGHGGLGFIGDDPKSYKAIYDLKSKENPKAWTDLIQLTRVISTTPPDQLPAALEPLLDVEGALRFLALENALINNDGYWIRASDYALYQDPKGQFHVLPHDFNETFSLPGGPGGPGGPGRRGGMGPGGPGGAGGPGGPGGQGGPGGPPAMGNAAPPSLAMSPLYAAKDTSKPLLSKLLAVPAWRTRYLQLVGEIATKWLDWERLGPIAEAHHNRIASWVKADTRKLDSTADFEASLTAPAPQRAAFGPPGTGPRIGIRTFAEGRRAALLADPEIQAALRK